MTDLSESLIKQMKLIHEFKQQVAKKNNLPYQNTIHGLVLQHGVGRFGSLLPKRMRKGLPQRCFQNAYRLMKDEERFIYCEGFAVRPALGILLGEHAWVLDKNNNYAVVDRTWMDPETACYLGIPMNPIYVAATVYEKKTYGVLENWENGFPILKDDPFSFLYEEVDQIPRDFLVKFEEMNNVVNGQHHPTG